MDRSGIYSRDLGDAGQDRPTLNEKMPFRLKRQMTGGQKRVGWNADLSLRAIRIQVCACIF